MNQMSVLRYCNFTKIAYAVVFLIVCLGTSAQAQVGFQNLKAGELIVGVWYPTNISEKSSRLGPFDVTLAFDAEPVKAGKYQVVLMSHGNSGRMRNHHLTAKALANAGFIAIAPLHTADHLVGGDDTYKAMNWRVMELAHALEAVIQIDSFRQIVDTSRVHAIGYSLGAITALNAAGIGLDKSLIDEHCSQNEDPAFCDTPSWLLRQKLKYIRGVSTPSFFRKIPDKYFTLPFVNGGVAVIAPVGQGIVYDENFFSAQNVFVLGFLEDKVTVPEFHAKNINDVLAKNVIAHYSLRKGHHSAFIAPFAKRVTDEEFIEAAQDPPDFNRPEFLTGLNNELVGFFSANRN